MPSLTLLQPVRWSAGTRLGMLALRGYLIVGAVLLVVMAIQVSHGLPRMRNRRLLAGTIPEPPPSNRQRDQHYKT
jgi:hypothetical protein